MMTAPRQVDGVAKILTKSGTERLKNPAVKPKLLQAEFLSCAYVFFKGFCVEGFFFWFQTIHQQHPRTILADCWQLLDGSPASENKKMATFGRLAVRACLHVVQKEKLGKEPDGHKDLKTIGQLFVDELSSTQSLPAPQDEDTKNEMALKVCDTLGMSKAELAFLQHVHIKVAHKQLGCMFCCRDKNFLEAMVTIVFTLILTSLQVSEQRLWQQDL